MNDETTMLALAALYELARTRGSNQDIAAITHLAGDLGYKLSELAALTRKDWR